MKSITKERLGPLRVLMVLSSLAPLFILMAIRGNSIVPECLFVGICVCLAIVRRLSSTFESGLRKRPMIDRT